MCQSLSQESVWDGCTLQPVSGTPWVLYVVSSAGVKIQDGRKKEEKERTDEAHKNRTKQQQKDTVWVKQDSKFWEEQYPTG